MQGWWKSDVFMILPSQNNGGQESGNNAYFHTMRFSHVTFIKCKPYIGLSNEWCSDQGFCQDFENACLKDQFQNFCPSRFSLPATSNLYYNNLTCQKGQLTLHHVIEDGLLEKYLIITTKKSKLKIIPSNFCLSTKLFRKMPVQKTDRMGLG